MSAQIKVLKGGAVIASIGAPGWAWDLRSLRAQVMCAMAQLQSLEVNDDDRADATARVLSEVALKLDLLATELEHRPREGRS